MFDSFEALKALQEAGTMTRAATNLKVTQSAVSKRISKLEHELGKSLIEHQGRRVFLTPYAHRMLQRAEPLLRELKDIFAEDTEDYSRYLSVSVSQAVLMSWGASTLAKVQKDLISLELDICASGAATALENVRSGDQMLALVRGTGERTPDLGSEPILDEHMVIVPKNLKPFRIKRNTEIELIAVDPFAEAQNVFDRKIRRLNKSWNTKFKVVQNYQTSAVVAQIARAGLGHGVVPYQVAKVLGIKKSELVNFPKPGVRIPVSIVGRRSTLARPVVRNFLESLRKNLPKEY